MKRYIVDPRKLNYNLKWIKPIGGLGDSLILSSVLYQIYKKTGQTFGMYNIPGYISFFNGHPAIEQFGFPPDDFPFLKVDYWSYALPGPGKNRPFYLLSKMLCGKIIGKEKLWININKEDRNFIDLLPVKNNAIILSTGTNSPRKKWSIKKWIELVHRIKLNYKHPIIQVGVKEDDRIPGIISLQGRTRPRHVFAILEKCLFTISPDSFLVHATRYVNKKAVVLWGPTSPEVYGYKDHVNIKVKNDCLGTCFGKDKYEIYRSQCDKKNWCMDNITVDLVFQNVSDLIKTI